MQISCLLILASGFTHDWKLTVNAFQWCPGLMNFNSFCVIVLMVYSIRAFIVSG